MLDRDLEPDHDRNEDFIHRDSLPDFDQIHKRLNWIYENLNIADDFENKMAQYIVEIRELLGDL